VNGIFTTVTICVPGTSSCQAIGNVLVDTGSAGLRILSSAGGGALTLTLPQQNDTSGNAISECNEFEDGYTYGPVRTADIKISGEQASSAAIQVIGDAAFSAIPASCVNTGLTSENTLQSLGANGVLGIGPYLQDCGSGCVTSINNNSDIYYSCPSSGCQDVVLSLAKQVQNPISLFTTDNNGAVIELPAIADGGANTVSGSMVFGIGTQSNNALGSATVFPADIYGNMATSYGGTVYPSFLDTGSNAIYFLDESITQIPVCSDSGFYCPSSTTSISVTNQGDSGSPSQGVSFNVANADALSFNFTSFNDLAAPWGPPPEYFDFGLPFFFGRNVYTAIEGTNTPGGSGPYFAY
jgi:hypothetical protein